MILLWLLLLQAPPAPTPTSAGLAGWLRDSNFVFDGTIRRLGAATLPEVVVTPNTAVVLVRRMLESPPGLGSLAGQEVTVVLGRPGRVNERATFFARGWLYGVSVAVIETHRRDAPRRPPWSRSDVDEARRQNADEDFARHLARADLVVVGGVVRVSSAGTSGEVRGPTTEHDPEWREAILRVERFLAGTAPEGALAILFPKSDDIRWFAVPKLKEGQRGIFLLHHLSKTAREGAVFEPKEREASGPGDDYAILDAEDFQPLSELERIGAALKRTKEPGGAKE